MVAQAISAALGMVPSRAVRMVSAVFMSRCMAAV
jgi:antitoxin component of RelBE/YafQ-DinJ toxin-antitoxin module